jgi:hypothetical protein
LHGYGLALSMVIIKPGPHQVIALLPAFASELNCSRKSAVCLCRKDFPALRTPTIGKNIDEFPGGEVKEQSFQTIQQLHREKQIENHRAAGFMVDPARQ